MTAPIMSLGKNCKLFYNSTPGIVAATELTGCRDVTLSLETEEVDTTTRATGGWEASQPVLKRASIEFQLPKTSDPAVAVAINAIKTAYMTHSPLSIRCLDGPIGSGSGLNADMNVMTFKRNEAIKDVVAYDVTLKIANTGRVPNWE